ncbi:unnamed protein product [Symbiodinium natans]|uniref:Uncharacterized protein n=1 Tax=Symbiodinium natans TaxID=878477 RepID=A0A812RE00_9DINO|nr:unnamed protein product [Symbiodinium natans]
MTRAGRFVTSQPPLVQKFAFSSAADQRIISEQRIKELEELLGKKAEESEKLATESQRINEEQEQVRRDVAELEQQSRSFLEERGRKTNEEPEQHWEP